MLKCILSTCFLPNHMYISPSRRGMAGGSKTFMNNYTVNYASPPPPYQRSVSPSSHSSNLAPLARPPGIRKRSSSLKYLAVTVFVLFFLFSYLLYRFIIKPTFYKETDAPKSANLPVPPMTADKNLLTPSKALTEGADSVGKGGSPIKDKPKPTKPTASPVKDKTPNVKDKDKDKGVEVVEDVDEEKEKDEEPTEPDKKDKGKDKDKVDDDKSDGDKDKDKDGNALKPKSLEKPIETPPVNNSSTTDPPYVNPNPDA